MHFFTSGQKLLKISSMLLFVFFQHQAVAENCVKSSLIGPINIWKYTNTCNKPVWATITRFCKVSDASTSGQKKEVEISFRPNETFEFDRRIYFHGFCDAIAGNASTEGVTSEVYSKPINPAAATPSTPQQPVTPHTARILNRTGRGSAGEFGNWETLNPGAPSPTNPLVKTLFFLDLPDWSPDNMHWSAPSSITFKSSGQVTLRVKQLANMKRTGSFLDTGNMSCARVSIKYFKNDACSGEPFNVRHQILKCLDYKQKDENHVRDINSKYDDANAKVIEEAKCISVERSWRL